ncbi:pentapeptide repeat-containing protein [Candidatus Uabimicrobium amorphum]|uniref:Pentapeptide repeat-containing protein n=1 Tax=Uabimicrobium amorphum TaxID=2596890 RepID=A0A5S9IM35_UABAM|nr:pentapeptide repeat-containing protein [Candidatus Uabimicrobium amorphum]BBM84413.1 hypothetical protein UABAM_02772 [Candidatus Uabimicrobium amorphum]
MNIYLRVAIICGVVLLHGCGFMDVMRDVSETTQNTTKSLKNVTESLQKVASGIEIDQKSFNESMTRTSENIEKLTASLHETTEGISQSTANIAVSTKSMADTAHSIDNLTQSLSKATNVTNKRIENIFDKIDSAVVASQEMIAPLKQVSQNSQKFSQVIDKTVDTANKVLDKVQGMSSDGQLSKVTMQLESLGSSVDASLKNFEKITANASEDYKNLRSNVALASQDLKKEAIENFDRLTDQVVKTLKNPYAYGPWVALFALLLIFYFLSTQSKRRFQNFIRTQGENFRRQSAQFEVMQNLRDLSDNIALDKWRNPLKTTVIKSNLLTVFDDAVPNLVQLSRENVPLVMRELILDLFCAQKDELYKKDLRRVHLEKAHCSGVNFYKSDLRHAYLCEGEFTEGDFCKADLSNADFDGANLEGAQFKSAKLVGANLCNADLSKANLAGANLKNANLENANLCGVSLKKANLTGANLHGANLEGVDLEEANFSGTIFENLTESKILTVFRNK